jgi:hypothetical protein
MQKVQLVELVRNGSERPSLGWHFTSFTSFTSKPTMSSAVKMEERSVFQFPCLRERSHEPAPQDEYSAISHAVGTL